MVKRRFELSGSSNVIKLAVELLCHKADEFVVAQAPVFVQVCLRDDVFIVCDLEHVEEVLESVEYRHQLIFANVAGVVAVKECKGLAQLVTMQVQRCAKHSGLELAEFYLVIFIGIHYIEHHVCAAHGYLRVACRLLEDQVELVLRYQSVFVSICSQELMLNLFALGVVQPHSHIH